MKSHVRWRLGVMGMLLSVATLSCGTATVSSPPATPTDHITVVPPTAAIAGHDINITRQDYTRALTKWRDQGIQEYQLKVLYSGYTSLMGVWRLRILRTDKEDSVVEYVREPGPMPPTIGLGAPGYLPTSEPAISELKNALQELTIARQFLDVESALRGEWKDRYTFSVSFDPALGYPTSVIAEAKPTASDPWGWSVQEMHVLKKGVAPVP